MPSGAYQQYANLSEAQINDILTSDLSIRKLTEKHGIGFTYVRGILSRAGIKKTTRPGPIAAKKSETIKSSGLIQKFKQDKPKAPIVRKQTTKTKAMPRKNSVKPMAKTPLKKQLNNAKSIFEEQEILKKSAENLMQTNNLTEKQQREKGFRWIQETDQYGKKKMVFRDPNKKPST